MTIGYTNTQYYSAIANAIREKTKTTNQLRPSEMAPAILSIKSGGGGASESTDPEELYAATRPTDWLTMPTESEINDDELYLLFHIPDGGSASIAFSVNCTGSYTVSLLTSESRTEVSSKTIDSGSSYRAQLSSSDFGDLTSNGMKQTLIKISGTNITQWSKSRYSDYAAGLDYCDNWNIVEMVGKLPTVQRINCGGDEDSALTHLKYFTLFGSTQLTNAANMFACCTNLLLIRQLDTSHITNMASMFYYCKSLKALPTFDTSSATDMSSMFAYAGTNVVAFNLDLSSWNVTKVTNMSSMFENTGLYSSSFSLNASNWNMLVTTNMSKMFSCTGKHTTTFLINISGWSTPVVVNMTSMFEYAGSNATTWSIEGLSGLNTGNVTTMSSMFRYAGYNSYREFTLDLSNWNVSRLQNASHMFYAMAATAPSFNLNLSGWDTSKVTSTIFMFSEAGANANSFVINLDNWNTSSITSMQRMFFNTGRSAKTWSIGNLSGWNTANVTNMCDMFSGSGYNAKTWSVGDLSNWNTSKVTDMSGMFSWTGYNATSWSAGTLMNWNTSKVTDMSSMFYEAGGRTTSFDLDLSNWDVSKVTNMSYMFNYTATSATTWSVGDISNWNTSSVTDMSYMFSWAGYNATDVLFGNLANWNTANVTNMHSMFESVGYNLQEIFELVLSNWNTSKVTDMSNMFYNCVRLYKIYVSNLWTVDNVTYSDDMFYNCHMIAGANGTSYDPSYIDKTYAKIDSSSNSGYLSPVYNITLKHNDGTTPDTSFKAISVSDLPIPTRAGYIFDGWYQFTSATTTRNFTTSDFTSTSTYKWTYNSSYGYWESTGNKGTANSVSVLKTVAFTAIAGDKLSFNWRSNGESNFDYAAWNIWDINNNKWLSGASAWGTSSNDSTTGLTPDSGLATTKGAQSSSTWTKNTYTFKTDGTYQICWTYRKDGSANSGTDLAYVSNVAIAQTRTVIDDTPVSALSEGLTLMAKWSLPSYTITYVLNGGTGVSDGTYTAEDAVTLPTPTKADHMFDGWYETEDFSGSKVTSIPVGSSGDKTFYAKWRDVASLTPKLKTGLAFNALIPSATTSIVFTDEVMPAGATLIDIDADGDGGVVGWLDGTIFKVSSQIPGRKIIANEDCSYMFCGHASIGNKLSITKNLVSIDFTNIDTSYVTNMSRMFTYAGYSVASFNLDLSNWNTSSVTNMSEMFEFAGYSATTWSIGDISNWDTSNVTNMSYMFGLTCYNATSCNLNLSSWNTSKVTSMSYMFQSFGYKASSWAIGDLSNWNTSNVTNMTSMFEHAGYSATTWSVGNISNWNTSNVTSMQNMFYAVGQNMASFNLDLSGWNTSNVTDMTSMFNSCTKLAAIYVSDLWNTSKVSLRYSENMFSGCISLVGGNGTAYNSSYIDKTYARLDTPEAPGYLSEKPYKLKTGLEFNALIPETATSIVFTDEAMPSSATLIDVSAGFNPVVAWLDGTTFKVSTQTPGKKITANEDCSYMFCGSDLVGNQTNKTTKISSITGLENLNTSSVTNMTCMFRSLGYANDVYTLSIEGLSSWNTSNVKRMDAMFIDVGYRANSWSIGDLSGWNTSKVVNMSSMFSNAGYYANSWSIGDISSWNTSNVTNMSQMFYQAGYRASSWSIGNLSGWNTSNVTNMSGMFNSAAYNSTIPFSLDLSGWDTYSVTNMSNMFNSAGYKATTWSVGDLSGWLVSNVVNMANMFNQVGFLASSLVVGDLSKWYTVNVTNMDAMFYRAGLNAAYSLNLSGWNVSKVTRHNNFNYGVESKVTPPKWK